MENKMTIKTSDTKLFRVSVIEGVSNCFYIRVKNSDLDKFDFETCLRNVFYTTNQQQAPPAGWKVYNFNTTFNWNPLYNIVIEICHDNDVDNTCSGCVGTNSAVEFSQTSFNSVYGGYDDNYSVCDQYTEANNLISSKFRPNMKFGIYAPTMVTWSPLTGLYINPTATQPYTGDIRNIVYAKNTSSMVYTASAGGCISSAQSILTINSLPGIPGAISGPTNTCATTTTYSISSMYDATLGYTWTVPNGITINNGQGTNSIQVSISSSFISGNITVASINSCGTGSPNTLTVNSTGTSAPATPTRITGSTNVCSAYTNVDQTSNNVLYSSSTVAGATGYFWRDANCWRTQKHLCRCRVLQSRRNHWGTLRLGSRLTCG